MKKHDRLNLRLVGDGYDDHDRTVMSLLRGYIQIHATTFGKKPSVKIKLLSVNFY